MLSVIIPSRNADYLQKTVDDLFAKASGELEVIIILDGYWPDPAIVTNKNTRIIHHGMMHNHRGMRAGINSGVSISRGEWVMKTDEHCMFDEGFDKKLIADCDKDWVVVPRRYRLDGDNWSIIEDGRPPIDYMYIAYPYERPHDKTCGLHGAEWKEWYHEKKDTLIDDTMSWQGSCWFCSREHWDRVIQQLDDVNYGPFTQEAQEIGNKTWLSGGRLVVNKKTWYAHYHKGKKGKGYGFSNAQYRLHQAGTEKGRRFCIDYWINDRWPEAVHSFEWLLEKFWPVPTWPENWKEQIKVDMLKDYRFSPDYKGELEWAQETSGGH